MLHIECIDLFEHGVVYIAIASSISMFFECPK
jgi:hypothetical protein